MPRLLELRLSSCGDLAASALVAHSWLALRELDVCACRLGDEELAVLATLHAPQLRELDLSDGDFSSLEALHSARWPALRALAVCQTSMDSLPPSIAAIADALPLLEDLDLSQNHLKRDDMEALVAAPLPCLSWLRLADCALDDSAMAPLADASWPNLVLLDLTRNGFGTAAAMVPLAKASLPQLWSLDLSFNGDLHPAALAGLSAANWPCLQRLYASGLQVSTVGAAGLTAALLPSLEVLVLYECTMPWAAVDKLATGHWPRLRRLNLGGSCNGVQVRRAGPSLVVAPWPALKSLVLRPNRLTSARAKTLVRKEMLQLKARWPALRLVYE